MPALRRASQYANIEPIACSRKSLREDSPPAVGRLLERHNELVAKPLVVPLLVIVGNVPIPAEDGVWRGNTGDLLEEFPAQHLALDGKTASLVVGEADALLAELL
ncbi:MAG: hypothetical protein V2A73_13395, partial [Pseudomonadota bacterium]